MPDSYAQAAEKTITRAGRDYRFRRPNAARMMEADVLAARYRGGLPASAVDMPALAEARAWCNVLCVDPVTVAKDAKGWDFGECDDQDLIPVYQELVSWLESFRRPVEQAQPAVGG